MLLSRPDNPKIARLRGDLDLCVLCDFWATRVYPPINISIGSAVFARLTNVTNRQTYRPRRHATPSVAIGCIFCTECKQAMRPKVGYEPEKCAVVSTCRPTPGGYGQDLTCDLLTSGSVHAEVQSWTMSTDFGADSSCRFSFTVQTNRQTDRRD